MVCLGLLILFSTMAVAQEQARPKAVSPFDFGLGDAATGEERYWALYEAHAAAIRMKVDVDYSGIDTLLLDIPKDAKTIPLRPNTDFKGLVIFVRNRERDHTLFSLSQTAIPIEIPKERLDNPDFSDLPELAEGDVLLILNDKHPWVAERIGYGSPAMRHDILYLRNGKAQNCPVAPWNTPATEASCSFCHTDSHPKTIANLTIHRDIESSAKTYVCRIACQSHVTIRNIRVTTPKSKLLADGIFSVTNCAHISFEDVRVEGTYSKAGVGTGYGYAFSLNNLWKSRFVRVEADGNWGVFGSNCMSNTYLEECNLNRFDIHCYGSDATCVRCTFQNKQTQFSSMYGTVFFDSCTFDDCIPLRIRSSYNAYTPFDIVMRNCTFRPTLRYHALVNLMLLDTNDNSRPELNPKCIPNVRIENMTVEVPRMVSRIILYNPTGSTEECTQRRWGHLSQIEINGLRTVRNGKPARAKLFLSDRPISLLEPLEIKLYGIELDGGTVIRNFE